ncbi:MAG: WD40 repeat domain-containing protein [Leptolyngbya sp. SIO3F4]|nr:WD40 repeat domain-containing protein [Leptolyngbya sp. SIO3F4]
MAFVEMQSVATNLDFVRDVVIPEYGIWSLNNGKLLGVSKDRRVMIMDPETSGGYSSTDISVPKSADAIKATPSGDYLVCFEDGLMRVIDSKGKSLPSGHATLYSDLSRLRITIAEWGVAVADEHSGLRLFDLPNLSVLSLIDDALPSQTPWLDPDQQRICYITTDGVLKLCDLTTGTDLLNRKLAEPTFTQIGPSPQLLMSPDYTQCAIAYGGGLVVIDMESGTHREPLLSHPGYRVWVSSDPGWNVMTAFAHGDPSLHLWDTTTWEPCEALPGHSGSVVSHSFTSDSKKLVTLDADGDLRVWASPIHSWRRGLGGYTGKTHQLAYSELTETLFTFDSSETLQAHSRTGEFKAIESEIRAVRVAVTDDQGFLATCDMGSSLEILPLKGDGPGRVMRLGSESIAGMQFRPGDHPPLLVVAQNPGALVHIDPTTAAILEVHAVPSSAVVSDLTFSDDGSLVALGLRDGSVAFLNLLESDGYEFIRTDSRQIRSLAFLPGSTQLLAVGDPGVLHVVNVQTGHIRTSDTLSEHSLFCVEVHPAGEIAMVGDRAGLVKAIRLSDMQELAHFDAVGSVMSMRFIDNGQSLAVSALDRSPEFWNLSELIGTFDSLHDSHR